MAETKQNSATDGDTQSGTQSGTQERGRQQELIGMVVSNAMDKTVVVKIERTIVHRLYHRYMRRTNKFVAHDEKNECRVGDRVLIVSSRPLSKTKRWRVREIVERAPVIETATAAAPRE